MQTVEKKVRTGKKIVGTVPVPVYETLAELSDGEDESRILSMFNKQNAVRIMGNERAKHTMAKVGKNRRFEIAYNLLWEIFPAEEVQGVIGNIEKLKEVVASPKVQEAVDSYIAEQKGEAE